MRAHNHWNRLAFAGFLFCLVWAPLPFASHRPWAAALLCILFCVVFLFWLMAESIRPSHSALANIKRVKVPLCCLLLIQIIVVLQQVPIPAAIMKIASPQAAIFYDTTAWRPLSLDVYSTQLYLMKGLCFSLAFLCTVFLVDSKRRFKLACYCIVGSGLLQATYGSMMVLSGLEYGFFVEKYVGRGAATGTFVNSNHFAGYMIICMSVAIGIIIAHGEKRGRDGNRFSWLHSFEYLLSGNGLLRIAVAVMIVALMLSHSRSANLFFVLALSAGVLVSMLHARKLDTKLIVLFIGFIVIDIIVVGQWFGLREVAERLAATQLEAEDRGSIAMMAFAIVRDFPLTGIGGGAFDVVFPAYKDAAFDLRYEHVHNDFIEIAAEVGLLGFLAFAGFFLSAMVLIYRRILARSSRIYRGVAYAGVILGVWLSLHSLTDFNMQIAANAMTVVVICGLIWNAASLPAGENQ